MKYRFEYILLGPFVARDCDENFENREKQLGRWCNISHFRRHLNYCWRLIKDAQCYRREKNGINETVLKESNMLLMGIGEMDE